MLAIRGLLLAGCSLASILLSGGTLLANDQPRATQHVRAFSAAGLRKVDERMRQAIEDGDAAGMVTLLGRVGEQIQLRSYGVQSGLSPMTPRSLFRIYSMTKPITGVAMMQLYEQGKWRLDDPVSLHAPELSHLKLLNGFDADGKPIIGTPSRSPTMRELMTHTAGFAYGLAGDDPINEAFRVQQVLRSSSLDEMMGKIAAIPLLHEPGRVWYYSVAVDIQGYLVQKLSGQPFGQYLRAQVFEPLGMRDTSFVVQQSDLSRLTDVYAWDESQQRLIPRRPAAGEVSVTDDRRLESGGGGLISTVLDYSRLCQMLLNGGELDGKRILASDTIRLMVSNQVGGLPVLGDGSAARPGVPGIGFGFDVAVYTDPSKTQAPYAEGTYFWAGMAGTWFWVDPVNKLYFIGMIQRLGPARPGGVDLQAESARLVYAALSL